MTYHESLSKNSAAGVVRSLRVLLAILLALLASAQLAAAQSLPAGAAPRADKRALILVSAAFGSTATDRYVSGLLNGLKKGGVRSGDISIEYLDLARHMEGEYRRALAALLTKKYSNVDLGAVFCVQQPALNFLLNDLPELAPQATVFGWTVELPHGAGVGSRQFVVQSTRLDYRGTLQRALELFPRTERVILIQGNSEVELSRWKTIREDLSPWQGKLLIEDTQALSVEEIEAKLAAAPENTILLGIGITRDAKGRIFVPPEFIARVVKTAKAPFFVVVDLGLESGAIGGMVTRLEEDAVVLSGMAADMLRGTTRLTGPLTLVPNAKTPMFNWQQLQRWGADPGVLPANTVFINRPPTLWGQYREYVIAGALVLFLFTALTMVLIWQNRRLRMATRALRTSEEGSRAITESARDAIITADSSGNIVGWNPGAGTIFGYTRPEVIGQPMTLLISERCRDGYLAGINRTQSGGQHHDIGKSIEVMGLHKDGSELPLDLSLSQWETADGWFVTGIIRDITERKRADESLRVHQTELESQNAELLRAEVVLNAVQARYFDLYDVAPVGYCTADEKGLILQANLTATTLFGVARGALVGQPLSRFIFKEDQDVFYLNRKQVFESKEQQAFELRMVRRDGAQFWAHLEANAGQGADGARELRVALSDITAQRNAEVALQKSEDQFQRVVDLSPYAMSLVNSDGTIEYINRKAIEIFGYLPHEIPDMDSWWILAYPDAGYRAEIIKQWTELVVKARAQNGEIESREYRVLCKNRSVKVLRIFGVWIENKVLAVFEDITERRRLEASYLQAQKLESLGTLSAGIAHDFNNVLGAILGFSDMAAEEVGPDHVAAESLKRINQASARATELVRRITTFGRRKEGKRVPTQVGEVVVEVISLLRATLPATISLATEFARDTPSVMADVGQIHEAVVNLTTNAAYAIGGKAGTIEYRTELLVVDEDLAQSVPNLNPGRFVRLSVTDSGSGMDAATIERIFDAFYTTKPIGEGTGLGLSMVFGIMQGHDGAVSVESGPGKGARFHLYFPVADVAAGAEQVIRSAERVVTAAKRVIYVDDEEPLAFLAKRVLPRMGHSVEVYTDPMEALVHFRAHPQDYDIVLTDLTMPGMSGFDLAREVLALRPDIPVLVTTGYVRDEDEVTAREIGIREIFLKPITVAELGRVFERVFRPPQREDKTQ